MYEKVGSSLNVLEQQPKGSETNPILILADEKCLLIIFLEQTFQQC
jgi:hypothetical protein